MKVNQFDGLSDPERIKIACNQLEYIHLPASFGVAKSTLDYVKQQSASFG